MRILLLHNRYRSQGGEERAVVDLEQLLRSRGHDVHSLDRSSEGLGRLRAARSLIGGGEAPEAVADAVRSAQADVVHAHNLHPLFGWRALAAAQQAGARTVLHLHNFRLFCAVAIGYRDGAPCFRCRSGDTWPGLWLRCRGSTAEAAAYAVGLRRQQPHLFDHADSFIAVSAATARRLIELGLPGGRTTALTNFVPSAGFAAESRAHEAEYALVSGRLVEEKGFDTAIAAATAAGVPLVVAGDGPDESRLRALANGGGSGGDNGGGSSIRFVGRVEPARLAELRAQAAVVLVPSRWEEPCPYAALDALATGVPVLASDMGGLPELVDREHLLPPGDTERWADALAELMNDPARRREQGERVLADARTHLSEETYYDRLMSVYGGG